MSVDWLVGVTASEPNWHRGWEVIGSAGFLNTGSSMDMEQRKATHNTHTHAAEGRRSERLCCHLNFQPMGLAVVDYPLTVAVPKNRRDTEIF